MQSRCEEDFVSSIAVTRSSKFIFKFIIYIFSLGISAYFISVVDGLLVLPFQLLMALTMVYGVELQHQALHLNSIKSRKLSHFLGFLLGAPMLVSFSYYRDNHLHHHQTLGTKNNEEFFDYGDKALGSFKSLFIMFFMVNHYISFIKRCYFSIFGGDLKVKNKKKLLAIRIEYILLFMIVLLMSVYSIYQIDFLIFYAWIFPLIILAAPIHTLIELPEHYKCNLESVNVLENTRTIKSNSLMFWFTNGNNFHVEHHYSAAWPMDQLDVLHKQIGHLIVNKNISYREFYAMFVRDVIDSTLLTVQLF